MDSLRKIFLVGVADRIVKKIKCHKGEDSFVRTIH
jgi:hypothetical protein